MSNPRDEEENPHIYTPQPTRAFVSPSPSPFGRSLIDILHPLSFGDLPSLPPTPVPAGRSLNHLSPFLPDRTLHCLKTKKHIEKLDLLKTSSSEFKMNEMSVTVNYIADEAPVAKRPKKPSRRVSSKNISCNCERSKCLKLYCDCFAAGLYCNGCNCVGCENLTEFEAVRREAIAATLDRNPHAFKPKFKAAQRNGKLQHGRGCNCTRSACLKGYCECFENGVECSDLCNCQGCKNRDGEVKKKTRVC